MTKDDYQIKIKELRELRDFHLKEAEKYSIEMNEIEIDAEYNNVLKGEYIILDYSPTGYKIYFHVDEWQKEGRGVLICGKGFYKSSNGINIINRERILYEESRNCSKTIIITEEEYNKAFNCLIDEFKSEFIEIK